MTRYGDKVKARMKDDFTMVREDGLDYSVILYSIH